MVSPRCSAESMSNNPGRFPTTNWSLIGRATGQADTLCREALNDLLARYWPALKTYLVVARRIDPHEANDLVQGFIENKILERDLVARADRARGKFRTLLLTALDNYVANQFQRRNANKRRPDRAVGMETHPAAVCASGTSPESQFEIQWARELIAEATRRVQEECLAAGRSDLWGVFEARVLAPVFDGSSPVPYDEIVQRFGFRSPSQSSNALITAKRIFARQLRGVIAEYAQSGDEINEELRELHLALSRPG